MNSLNTPATCPHFSHCSGCEVADFLNPPIWRDALQFFCKRSIEPDFISQGFSQTRFKAKLAVRPGPHIGLFKRNTHEVISIPHCQVHHPSINKAVSILNEEIVRHNIIPYQENHTGALRYIQLFADRASHQIQLTLITTQPLPSPFIQSLLKHNLWHSIWINHHPDANNCILGPSWQHLYGPPFLWQTLNQTPIAFHPGAFSQTHLPLFEKMVQKIQTWVHPSDSILELYAGVGAIGLTLRHPSITLVENNPFAHLSFQQSRSPIPYLCIDAKGADLTPHNLIIVDPPRKGLDPLLLKKLTDHRGRLIYVSCGFDSFKRDAQVLLSSGWKIKEAQGYLLFPGTNHVEILALFEKRGF